jgi:hypothetical protein
MEKNSKTKKDIIRNNRLKRNFHKTFIPERQYINAILKFSASGGVGNYQEISSQTYIPMGKSSGKVPAIMDYCKGMGLIDLSSSYNKSIKQPKLTTLGRTVLLNDPFLKEDVTQWIAHFNLCDPISGADVWYYCFFEGHRELGKSFSMEDINKYLSRIYKINKTNLVGPLIRMYQDDSSFNKCNVLQQKNDLIFRRIAPMSNDFSLAYGAWILELMKKYFPNHNQVSITELEEMTGWRSISGWDYSETEIVLELIQRKELLEIDRTMKPWLLRALKDNNETWKAIYDDMI